MAEGKRKSLAEVCCDGDLEEALSRLAAGESAAWSGADGKYPLEEAAREGWLDVLEALLSAGARARGPEGRAALRAAAGSDIEGSLACLERLLELGADPSAAASGSGRTAGHMAAEEGNAEALRSLLRAGLDPEIRDEVGWRALETACASSQEGCARLLLEAGSDPNARGRFGRSAGYDAVLGGSEGCVRALLESGWDPEQRDDLGGSAMDTAALIGRDAALLAMRGELARREGERIGEAAAQGERAGPKRRI